MRNGFIFTQIKKQILNPFSEIIRQVNEYSRAGTPFLLLTDFEGERAELHPVADLPKQGIRISFPGQPDQGLQTAARPHGPLLEAKPIPYSSYLQAFDTVQQNLRHGNSFLTNLTARTPVALNTGLDQVYHSAAARYKILYRDAWVCFSPETFIRIHQGEISSCPMKGTIDAAVPNAEQHILSDPKETAEHYTIVDLIRNDLSMVATDVQVRRFRYIDRIHTSGKTLLQVSSEITGTLPGDYREHLGEILFRLLPAGSVSGAPKEKTCAIIREAEQQARGFYTGVAFLFDGETVDSCVLIRYIEKTPEGFAYRSGGGITVNSDPETEYRELLDKIYVPRI